MFICVQSFSRAMPNHGPDSLGVRPFAGKARRYASVPLLLATLCLLTVGFFPAAGGTIPSVGVSGHSSSTAPTTHSFASKAAITTATYPNGVDVYHGQGTITWSSVYSDGVVFAFAKATQGTDYKDPDFTTYMANGHAAGLYMGAYDFACPATDSSEDCTADNATAEANYFLGVAGPYFKSGYLYPALDLEVGCGDISASAMTAWVEQWMDTVENYAKTNDNKTIIPIIYMSQSYASTSCMTSAVTQYSLWIADPGASSPGTGFWPTWTFWQYSWTGTVPGISGDVDEDYYNGNLSQMVSQETFGGNGSVTTPLTSSYAITDLTNGSSAVYCGDTVPSGDKLQFTGTAAGGAGNYTYAWKFGDGTTGIGNPVNHSYSATGSVNPLLTVTDSKSNTNTTGQGCDLTIGSGLLISKALTATPGTIVLGNTTTLSVTVTGGSTPYSYKYVGLPPGCATKNSSSISCTPSKAGNYSITVFVNDSAKRSVSSNTALVVKAGSVSPTLTGVTITASSTSIYTGGTTNLTATPTCSGGSCPTSGITYAWSLNNSLGTLGSVTAQSTVFTAGSSAGVVSIQVVATLNSVSQTKSVTVTILSSTVPTLSSVSVSPTAETVNESKSAAFTATPQCTGGSCPASGITYAWSLNNSLGTVNPTTGSSTTFQAGTTPGTVSLTVTATLNSISQKASSTITIPQPATGITLKSISLSPASASIATGNQRPFSATVSCNGGTCPQTVSIAWSVNNTLASVNPTTGTTTTLTAGTSPGAVTLTAIATLGTANVSGTASIAITGTGTTTPTLASVSISPQSGSLAAGDSQSYTATPTCTGAKCPTSITYSWGLSTQGLGSISPNTGSAVTFASNGTVGTVTLSVTATMGTESARSSVTIKITGKSSTGPSNSTSSPLSFLGNTTDLVLIGVIAAVAVAIGVIALRPRKGKPESIEQAPPEQWGEYPPPQSP